MENIIQTLIILAFFLGVLALPIFLTSKISKKDKKAKKR